LQFEAPEYSDEGIQSFRDFIKNEAIIKRLEFWGAYEELRGVIALRENREHICFFFVKAEYHRLGFADTDAEQAAGGIRYTPMKFERQKTCGENHTGQARIRAPKSRAVFKP